jgi:hypothetical protein
MLLYRPVGLNELRLIYQADLRAFPPRLPEQPIFYPVTNQGYAEKIARDWNTKSESHVGLVTRFSVDDAYAGKFQRRVVGSREHEELWVPAEELPEFNEHLEDAIQVTGAYFGQGFVGEVPEQGALQGKHAREQVVALARMLEVSSVDVAGETAANHQAVFLNYFFWEHLDLTAEGIGVEERDRVLDFIRRNWARTSRGGIPLGVVPASAPEPWEAKVGQTVTIEGVAQDAKLGALVLTGGSRTLWIDGLDAWPEGMRGKRVRVTGKMIQRSDLPVFVEREGEPIMAGIPVPPGSDLEKSRRRFLLTEATWKDWEEDVYEEWTELQRLDDEEAP